MAEHPTKRKHPSRPTEPKNVGLLNGLDHRLGPNAQPVRKAFDQTRSHQEEYQEEEDHPPRDSFFIDTQEDHQQAISDFIMFILLWIALPAWIFSELVLTLSP